MSQTTQTVYGQVFTMINKLFETSRTLFSMTFPHNMFLVASQTVAELYGLFAIVGDMS